MKLSAVHIQSTESLFFFLFFFTWVSWFLNSFNLAPGLWTVDCSCSGIDFRLYQFIIIVFNFKEPPSLAGISVCVEVDKWLPSRKPDLFFFFFKFIDFIYLFILAALNLHCCAQSFSSCGERGLLFVVVHRLLIVVASVVEHGL